MITKKDTEELFNETKGLDFIIAQCLMLGSIINYINTSFYDGKIPFKQFYMFGFYSFGLFKSIAGFIYRIYKEKKNNERV